MQEAVYFKEDDEAIYVRAEGHVTATLCPSLKARVFARLDDPAALKRIAVDLSACEYMDSTFLGLLVGMHKRLVRRGGERVAIYGANEACIGLLRTIGVSSLVDIRDGEPFEASGMERVGDAAKATAEFILDAHEELSGLSSENKDRFAILTAALKSAVRQSENR